MSKQKDGWMRVIKVGRQITRQITGSAEGRTLTNRIFQAEKERTENPGAPRWGLGSVKAAQRGFLRDED